MTTFEYVKKVAESQGLNIYQLELKCDLAVGTIRKWRVAKPSPKSAIKVADVLQIPVSYIYNPDESQPIIKAAPPPALTKQEEELIELYRSLSLRKQADLINYALSLETEDAKV